MAAVNPPVGTVYEVGATNRDTFAARLSQDTGLDPNVVAAWVQQENGNRTDKTSSMGNQNWLNVGVTDSGPIALARSRYFSNPVTAADMTYQFLQGKWGGASSGILNILKSAKGAPPDKQITAIASSGWATDPNYAAGIRKLYNGLSTQDQVPVIGPAVNAVKDVGSAVGSIAALLTSSAFWIRLGEAIAGALLLAMGLRSLTGTATTPVTVARAARRRVAL